ncbi:MAG TPA: hypothetical protein VJQ54_01400 [Candidatus Sulfotelmatobacter sp.]|nr:hypothetical protein [Candidatus Sulfotelmatobacter sp.]
MRSLLRNLRAAWKLRRVSRALGKALALHRRGEVRSDGLSILEGSIKLTVSWRARDIHPWDRDLPKDRAAGRLLDQTLHDTEDAVERIFSAFPEASSLELNVFENDPSSNKVIMSGVVERSDLGRCEASSIAMRLRMLGINYRVGHDRLDPIATVTLPSHQVRVSSRDLKLGRRASGVRQPSNVAMKSTPGWRDNDHGRH